MVVLLAGCVPSVPRDSVYVDMAQVEKSFPAPATISLPGQEEPASAPGLLIDIPALPATTLRSPKGKGEVQIRDQIEAARQKAKRQLQNRLRDVYFAEIDRKQEEAIAGLSPELAKAAEGARQSQLALFHAYAEEKGARLARLTLLAGFPDPDPGSKNPKPDFAVAKRFREEADRIRTELVDLDAKYDAAVQEIFDVLQHTHDAMLTKLRAQFEEAKGSAEEKARQEADDQMAKLNKAFGQTLAEAREISVPGQPAKSLQSPPVDLRGKLIHVPTPTPLDDRTLAIKNQLTIWEAVKGYRIVTSPSAGRDGTPEFLEWLRSHLPGH